MSSDILRPSYAEPFTDILKEHVFLGKVKENLKKSGNINKKSLYESGLKPGKFLLKRLFKRLMN